MQLWFNLVLNTGITALIPRIQLGSSSMERQLISVLNIPSSTLALSHATQWPLSRRRERVSTTTVKAF